MIFRMFILSWIEYLHSWEKETWNLYPVMFYFRGFADMINICKKKLAENSQNKELIKLLSENIFEMFDSFFIVKLMMNIIKETSVNNFAYSGGIFNVIWFLMNALMTVRLSFKQTGLASFTLSTEDFMLIDYECKNIIEMHMKKLRDNKIMMYSYK